MDRLTRPNSSPAEQGPPPSFASRVQTAPASRTDPRHYQIAVLASLLVYGMAKLHFDVGWVEAGTILGTALVTQLLGTRLARLPAYDPRSALISGLSLCLLLRTESLGLAAAGSVLAVGSKFVLRWRGKHVFNPTNFALAVLLGISDRVWVSSGQWGSGAVFAFALACAGGLVVHRALRSDVTFAFLGAYGGLLAMRAIGLGDPWSIPLYQIQNGALVLFAFFMISDPRTTPDSRTGRIVFGILVALGAHYVSFRLFRTNGLLWSLALLSPLVPALDRWLPGPRYEWPGRVAPNSLPSRKGEFHETVASIVRGSRSPVGAWSGARHGVLRLLRRQG